MEYQSGAVSPTGSISQGWNLIKDNYWLFFGMTLVAFIIIIIAAVILDLINNGITMGITAVLGMAAQDAGEVGQVSAQVIPQLISMVISIFTNIIVVTLSGVLICGIYRALSRQSAGESPDFGDVFSGFQLIMPCLIFAVALSIIQFIINVILLGIGLAIGVTAMGAGMITSEGGFNPAAFGGLFLGIMVLLGIYLVVNIIIGVLTTFAYPLIAEREMSGGQALLTSIKSGFSNFFGLLLLLILLGLMAIAGLLACFVGFFFVAPVLYASIFAAFRSVFGGPVNLGRQTPPPPPTFGNQPGY